MGNIVGMPAWAFRDRALFASPHPQMNYDEHVKACLTLMPRLDRLLNKFCGFHYNGDWESDYSVNIPGHVAVCLSVLWSYLDLI